MEGKGSVKVEGGKLVNAKLKFEEKIEKADIRGDFFIEPPDALNDLEQQIEGLEVDSSVEEIKSSFEDLNADLIGFSAGDVAEAVRDALGDEK